MKHIPTPATVPIATVPGYPQFEMEFGLAGSLQLASSFRKFLRRPSMLTSVVSSLGTALVSGTITVLIKKNGTTVVTVTLVPADLFGPVTTTFTPILFEVGDYISVTSTAVGVGATDLLVEMRWG